LPEVFFSWIVDNCPLLFCQLAMRRSMKLRV
jgi:hypothetical protein